MDVQLFPDALCTTHQCYGLTRANAELADPLVPITWNTDAPLHLVHSSHEHLAYITGLLVLQAWTAGLDDNGPLSERRPVLLITERPGTFAEAYLRLEVPADQIDAFSTARRMALYQRGQSAKASANYWDQKVGERNNQPRLHNMFPACDLSRPTTTPSPIASREYFGRGDDSAQERPALLIARPCDADGLALIARNHRPYLTIIDTDALPTDTTRHIAPTIAYHESLFAPELARLVPGTVYCLPDQQLKTFTDASTITLLEPHADPSLTEAWEAADFALSLLIADADRARDRTTRQIERAASLLRNVLLALPVGVDAYEQAVVYAQQPPASAYDASITEPLDALGHRLPEMTARGALQHDILKEVVKGFRTITNALRSASPKAPVIIQTVNESIANGRRVAVVAPNTAAAAAMTWISRLPAPHGLALPDMSVRVLTLDQLAALSPDEDCVLHQAFDPHTILTRLARLGPRHITFVLLPNELRFLNERFMRARRLAPEATPTVFAAIYAQLDRLAPPRARTTQPRPTLFSDSDFDLVQRLFEQGPRALRRASVLLDDIEAPDHENAHEVDALLIWLHGDLAVLLDANHRLPYVAHDHRVTSGTPADLEPGHALIIIDQAARESLKQSIVTRRKSELPAQLRDLLTRWKQELREGRWRLGLTQVQLLERIQTLGSQRLAPGVIGQWERDPTDEEIDQATVLGPLDPIDLQRIGQIVKSSWLQEHWQEVGRALLLIRDKQRRRGRQLTELLQRAAIGDDKLTPQDNELLERHGITPGRLKDAVTLITVKHTTTEPRRVPIAQLGELIPI